MHCYNYHAIYGGNCIKVRVAFNPLGKNTSPPAGHQLIPYHWVFNIKMDFSRKARLVAGGNKVDSTALNTYSSVVSRDSIRIIFLVAALNDLDIWMSDVGNAYLNAKPREKVNVILGEEFGADAGQAAIIVRALYGLPGSGSTYHAHYASSLRDLGFRSSYADPSVWYQKSRKRDGTRYNEYLLVYVDDQLTVSEDPKAIIDALASEPFNYKLKDLGPPDHYLGARVGPFDLDGLATWHFSADDYLEKAIRNIEDCHGKLNELINKSKLSTPASPDYHPERDQSNFLQGDDVNLYQSYIGILRWAIELQQIDIAHAGATMAKFMANPREGHLDAVLRIFAYLKMHIRSKIVINQLPQDWSTWQWSSADWSEFYPDAQEAFPTNAPIPLGQPVQINYFVDAAHAMCLMSRRLTTGIVFFLNGTPIRWYSKRQKTIESSTFGLEFVVL